MTKGWILILVKDTPEGLTALVQKNRIYDNRDVAEEQAEKLGTYYTKLRQDVPIIVQEIDFPSFR